MRKKGREKERKNKSNSKERKKKQGINWKKERQKEDIKNLMILSYFMRNLVDDEVKGSAELQVKETPCSA